ncbi:hypothetical protein [Peribacillus simplex]|uniref:hypothetical protein n=1 Tax=Peribacillus simplex TaxID=1478 RepID=UPI003D266136
MDKGYSHGKIAGICSGREFKWFRDFPHLGMSGGLSMRDLQKGMRPNPVYQEWRQRTVKMKLNWKMDDALFGKTITSEWHHVQCKDISVVKFVIT